MVTVVDLHTGLYVAEYSCDAESAVIAAYAQTVKNDFNTWDYVKKYGPLIIRGKVTVICGDRMCALLPVDPMADFLKRHHAKPE